MAPSTERSIMHTSSVCAYFRTALSPHQQPVVKQKQQHCLCETCPLKPRTDILTAEMGRFLGLLPALMTPSYALKRESIRPSEEPNLSENPQFCMPKEVIFLREHSPGKDHCNKILCAAEALGSSFQASTKAKIFSGIS